MKTFSRIMLALLVLVAGLAVWAWTPDLDRDLLEERYLRAPEDLQAFAGIELHIRDDGPRDAPVLILIHGFGATLHTWEDWAVALQGSFRVIRFDLPGAGLSGMDATGIYTDARAGEVIAALMDALGIERAVLIGNSLGGRIAWRFAAERPERVSRLVLISPDGFATYGADYGEAVEIPFWVGLFESMLPKMMLRANLEAAYGDPEVLTDAVVDRYHDLMRAPGVRGAWIQRMAQTVLPDPEGILPGIAVPVLLVWGEKDQLIPFSHAQDYLRLLPDARLVSFPELGHVPQEEAPARSLAPVLEFLAPELE